MRKGSKTKGRKPKRNRSTCMMCKFDKHLGNGKQRRSISDRRKLQ